MKIKNLFTTGLAALVALALTTTSNFAAGPAKNGTTLAASKTIQICNEPNANGNWTIYGEISIWNEGAEDTIGLAISDTIYLKVGSKFVTLCTPTITAPAGFTGVIAAGTVLATATVFTYVCEIPADSVAETNIVKNTATITILNHSGSIGKAKGPSPSATWTGVFDCPASGGCTCTYSQGYWGNKPGVVWPAPYDRTALFFNSGLTWQQILDTAPQGNGYIILAQQYIASTLNVAQGSCAIDGVFGTGATYDQATAWFNGVTTPALACPLNSSCGTQKTWGGILDSYIQGTYPGSPGHCGEE